MTKWPMAMLAAVIAVSATAAPTTLETIDTEAFSHDVSGAELPAAIGSLQRTRVVDFEQGQFNIAAQYQNDEGSTFITLYLYRAGVPNVSLWFDRVVPTITSREGFEPEVGNEIVVRPFTPPGHDQNSGLRMSYSPRHGGVAGTAAALAQYGTWLVKIRASSNRFGHDTLDQLVDLTLAEFEPPDRVGNPGPAYSVEPCQSELAVGAAQQVPASSVEVAPLAMLFQGIGQTVGEDGQVIDPEPVTYCRDSLSTDGYGVYRANEATGGYVIALSDAGNVISVGRGTTLLDLARNSGAPIAITFQSSAQNLVFQPFDALPYPEAAIEVVNTQDAIAASDRMGNIQLFLDESE
ncbi:MAG: hypothetical protein AAGE05_00850 [Pseudomonadota bacterium]